MEVMCHISRHRYREDYWSRGRWSGVDEPEPGPEPRDVPVAASATPNRDPDLRVSQAERDQVAAVLARHFADGRLTVEEYEERVEAAFAARTGRDLEPLLADLPAADPPPAPARPATPRHQRRPFRAPAFPAARVVAVAAVVVLAIATGPWALWLLWPALVLTGGCGFGPRHGASGYHGRTTTERPPVVTRL
jgi:hypothetical protein